MKEVVHSLLLAVLAALMLTGCGKPPESDTVKPIFFHPFADQQPRSQKDRSASRLSRSRQECSISSAGRSMCRRKSSMPSPRKRASRSRWRTMHRTRKCSQSFSPGGGSYDLIQPSEYVDRRADKGKPARSDRSCGDSESQEHCPGIHGTCLSILATSSRSLTWRARSASS